MQCLYHEIIHAMFETIGIATRDGGPDEGDVDALAYILLSFLMDNGYLANDFINAQSEFQAHESREATGRRMDLTDVDPD